MIRSALSFLTLTVGALLGAAGSPKAVIDLVSHDFGNVRRGDNISHAFTLRNSGDVPLSLQGGEVSAPGLRLRFPPSIPPGAERRVVVEWNTADAKANATAEVLLRTNDPGRPEVTLALRATVVSPIEFRPMPAAFFSVYQGETAGQTVTLVNNEDRPLRVTGIEPEGSHFTATVREVTPGKVFELRLSVPAKTQAGRFMEAVHVRTDHPSFPNLRVGVNVFVKTELYANPESLDFGVVPLDRLAGSNALDFMTQTFLVKARRGPFELRSIESDVPGLAITRTPASGSSDVFRIDVAMAKEKLAKGPLKGSLQIRTSHPDFPEIRVPVNGEIR